MVKSLKLTFLLLCLSIFAWSTPTYAMTQGPFGVQVFSTLEQLNNGTLVHGGFTQACLQILNARDCPEPVKDFVSDVYGTYMYRLYYGEQPWNKCVEPQWTVHNIEQFEGALAKYLSHTNVSYKDIMGSCLQDSSNSDLMSDAGRNPAAAMLLTYLHSTTQNLSRSAVQTLNSLHEIDVISGKKTTMEHIECNNYVSDQVEESCNVLKECPRQPPRIKAYSNLIFKTLLATSKIDDQLEELKERRYAINSANELGLDEATIEELNKLDEVKAVLLETKEELLKTVPWVEGRIFKKKMNTIKKNLKKFKTATPAQQEAIKHSTSQTISIALAKQLQVNKKELLKHYGRLTEGSLCLRGQGDCDRFEEIYEKVSPYTEALDIPEEVPVSSSMASANESLQNLQCLDNEVAKARRATTITKTVAEIGVGFAIGGVGGIARMGMLAAKIYQNGKKIRGALALSGLVAEGLFVKDRLTDLKTSCSEARNQVSGLEGVSSQAACQTDAHVQVIKDFSDCITNFSIMAADVLLYGVGKKFSKASRLNNADEAAEALTKQSRIKQALDGFQLPKNQYKQFSEILKELDDEALEIVLRKLKSIPQDAESLAKFERYLKYTNTLKKSARTEALEDADGLFLRTSSHSSQEASQRFLKSDQKYNAYQQAQEQKIYKKLRQNNGMSDDEARALASKRARAKREVLQDTMYGCRSRKVTPEHKQAGQLFSKFSVSLGVAGGTFGYTNAHFHEKKNAEWFGKLGYEVTMAFFLSRVGAKIMKNPTGTIAQKYVKGNVGSGLINLIDAGIYSQIYGIDEDEARDQLNLIKNSPDKLKALEELQQFMDNENMIEKFRNTILDNYRAIIKSRDKYAFLGRTPYTIGDQTFDKPLTERDLDNPNMQDRLVQATIEEMYNKERGYLDFGSKARDRWVYDRGWNALIGVPKGMAIGVTTYYALCMGKVSPWGGMGAALGLQALNQFISADLYYKQRKKLINQ